MLKALGALAMAALLLGGCVGAETGQPIADASTPTTSSIEERRGALFPGATQVPCPPEEPPHHLCQIAPNGTYLVSSGGPGETSRRLALPPNATPYPCPEYLAIDVACYLDRDGRLVVATTSSSGGVTATSIHDPNCRIFLHPDGITSHRCSTPSTEESRANRVTWTPIECPADLPLTETDCHMGSNGELRSRSTVGTDLPPPANRYVPPS